MFDERLCEAFDEGVRYVLRRNPVRVEEMSLTRQSKQACVESFVESKNRYLAEHKRAKVEVALRDVRAKIRKLWVGGWLKARNEGRTLILEVDDAELSHESRFDGCYVLKTDLPADAVTKEVVHDRYKDLAKVDQAFRAMKTAHLLVRPVYVRLAQRTRAHVFVVMLSYMITRELEACLESTESEGFRRNIEPFELMLRKVDYQRNTPLPPNSGTTGFHKSTFPKCECRITTSFT